MAITHSFRNASTEAVHRSKKNARTERVRGAAIVHEDIHPGAYKAFVACWAALLAVFVATFAESPFTLFMLAIVFGYAIMFFGVPYILSRVAAQKTHVAEVPFSVFLRGRVDTFTGPVSGMEALMQILMVPLALTIGALSIGFIVHFEADHIHMLYVARSAAFPR